MALKTECLTGGTLRVTVPWRKTEVEVVFFEKGGKRCFKGTGKGAESCAFAGQEVDPNPQPKDVPPLLDGTPWPHVGGYGDRVRWHIVPGPHDLSIANWRHYLDAMDAMER